MFIRAYLRASSEDQYADRAKNMLNDFVEERGWRIANYYREHINGTKLERLERSRLLSDSLQGDR